MTLQKEAREDLRVRDGLVAQTATAVRSNFTMLLAFRPDSLSLSKTLAPPRMEVWGVEPQSRLSAQFYVLGHNAIQMGYALAPCRA